MAMSSIPASVMRCASIRSPSRIGFKPKNGQCQRTDQQRFGYLGATHSRARCLFRRATSFFPIFVAVNRKMFGGGGLAARRSSVARAAALSCRDTTAAGAASPHWRRPSAPRQDRLRCPPAAARGRYSGSAHRTVQATRCRNRRASHRPCDTQRHRHRCADYRSLRAGLLDRSRPKPLPSWQYWQRISSPQPRSHTARLPPPVSIGGGAYHCS